MNEPTRSASLNDNITTVIRLLMAKRGGVKQTQLADSVGLDKALINRSFAGKRPWKLEDLERMAAYFDVPPTLFLEDPESLFRSRCDSAVTPMVVTDRDLVAA
jgi:transcriptional regulator with XRE-family HTH domain